MADIIKSTFQSHVEALARDSGGDFYTDANFVLVVNMIMRSIVEHRPDANPVMFVMTAENGPRQNIPLAYEEIIDVEAVVDDSVSPVRYINRIRPGNMDVQNTIPTWTDTAGKVDYEDEGITLSFVDKNKPRTFWLYEPPLNGEKIQVVASAFPTPITTGSTTIPLDDRWYEPLLYGVMSGLYDIEQRVTDRSELFRTRWQTWLELQDRIDDRNNPNDRTRWASLHDDPGTGK